MTNLKRIRTASGLSQAGLAELSGVSLRMIQYYEQRVRDINAAGAMTVYQMACALDCMVEDLLEFGMQK
jgi:transcriptional regulator with XRE-family HTH domain